MNKQTTELLNIVAQGGIRFGVSLIGDNTNPRMGFLGNMEFGTIDADGGYEQDDDEIIDAARAEFDIQESIPARVR